MRFLLSSRRAAWPVRPAMILPVLPGRKTILSGRRVRPLRRYLCGWRRRRAADSMKAGVAGTPPGPAGADRANGCADRAIASPLNPDGDGKDLGRFRLR